MKLYKHIKQTGDTMDRWLNEAVNSFLHNNEDTLQFAISL